MSTDWISNIHFIHGCFNSFMYTWMFQLDDEPTLYIGEMVGNNQTFIENRVSWSSWYWKNTNIHHPSVSFAAFFPVNRCFPKRTIEFRKWDLWRSFFNFLDTFQCVSRFHSNLTPITAWVYSTRHFPDAYKCARVSRVPEMRLFLCHWVRMNKRNKLALAVGWFTTCTKRLRQLLDSS